MRLIDKSRNGDTAMNSPIQKKVAVVGSGPAGLMAASVLSGKGFQVTVFEGHRSSGPKLLVAGISGLNITSEKDLLSQCSDESRFEKIFKEFSKENWLSFVHDLGIETFLGTSGRYFIQGLKAGPLLKAWILNLKEKNVSFFHEKILTDFKIENQKVRLFFKDQDNFAFDGCCLALGGGSWRDRDTACHWETIFKDKKIGFFDWVPSNVGQKVSWKPEFLKECEGQPLKNIILSANSQKFPGELVVTKYGLEGTPIYNIKETQLITLDLKPDFTQEQALKKCRAIKENLSPLRRIKKVLNLGPVALALLFHHSSLKSESTLEDWINLLKAFPIKMEGARPLSEAISAAGGVSWDELDESLMLKKFPRVFLAGEMIDWDAPTGGFLIQACVSQGHVAGKKLAAYI